MDRKFTIPLLIAIIVLGMALCFGSILTFAAPQPKFVSKNGLYKGFLPTGDIRRFDGETLTYDISFLWFKKAASANVRFFRSGNRFYSQLVAETKGVVGWFTSYRKHFYKAAFEILDGGHRVRSLQFDREVVIGDDVDRSTNSMDYVTRTYTWANYSNDVLIEQGSDPIPPGIVFDDILAAFYNFRNGIYGPVQQGKTYTIHTIPEKGVDKMHIEVLDDKKKESVRIKQNRSQAEDLLIEMVIPKEIFKTKSGRLQFWGSRHLIPLETLVEDYIMLGDLRAKFVSRAINKSGFENDPDA